MLLLKIMVRKKNFITILIFVLKIKTLTNNKSTIIMKRIFTIDGNYFAHRTLGIINMGGKINNLETETEKNAFLLELNSNLFNLYQYFKPHINNVVFCVDSSNNWRKAVPPVIPYYFKDKTDIVFGYKEQRVEKKEKSTINYVNFYILFNKFVEDLKTKMIVFDIDGLEADDLLMLLSQKLNAIHNGTPVPTIETLVFCNDGDLNQIAIGNTILFRNIRSKVAPDGEFVMSVDLYKKSFSGYIDGTPVPFDFEQALLGSSLQTSIKKLVGVALENMPNKVINRQIGAGIETSKPNKVILKKSICGDKKDNLFSIFGWKSTTGTTNYGVTENHIENALFAMGYAYDEKTCAELLKDEDDFTSLILNLKNNLNQTVSSKLVLDHFKHNFRLNQLSINNLPAECVEAFETCWKINEKNIIEGVFDEKVSLTANTFKKDNAINVMENNLPVDLLTL